MGRKVTKVPKVPSLLEDAVVSRDDKVLEWEWRGKPLGLDGWRLSETVCDLCVNRTKALYECPFV
jgi:hypothetical protein